MLGTVDLDPDATGMKVSIWDGYFMVGLGFEITGEIGSNRIDATWQAEGDACRVVSDACDTSGNGQISYSEPDVSVDVGRLRAGDFSPAQDAHVRLTNFRYHLNQLADRSLCLFAT